MAKRKKIRTRGKLPLSRYFQELKEGEKVAVVIERSQRASFPNRLYGRTGVVCGKRGREYVIAIKDQEKEKSFLINAIHLKRIR